MEIKILVSGSGGQGIMRLGKILAQSALRQGYFVTWFPSYGAEMRGGTAHCFVRVSNRPIPSPLVEDPDIAVIMNGPSLDKFEKHIRKRGLLIANKDLIQRQARRNDIQKIIFPLTSTANRIGDLRTANSVALGVLSRLRPQVFPRKILLDVLRENFSNQKVLSKNIEAFYAGEKFLEG